MKRMLLTLLPASVLALSAPAVASAHHGRHHGRHHHASSARLVNFGAAATSVGTATPPVQATPTNENAGTVESFENGVLKIKLSNSTKVVEGKVNEQTELRCESATTTPQGGDDNQSEDSGNQQGGDQQGGNQEGNDQQSPSSDQFASQHGDSMAHAAWQSDSGGGDQGDDDQGEGSQENCSPTTALTKGATVREAELEFTGAGAVWEKVLIVH